MDRVRPDRNRRHPPHSPGRRRELRRAPGPALRTPGRVEHHPGPDQPTRRRLGVDRGRRAQHALGPERPRHRRTLPRHHRPQARGDRATRERGAVPLAGAEWLRSPRHRRPRRQDELSLAVARAHPRAPAFDVAHRARQRDRPSRRRRRPSRDLADGARDAGDVGACPLPPAARERLVAMVRTRLHEHVRRALGARHRVELARHDRRRSRSRGAAANLGTVPSARAPLLRRHHPRRREGEPVVRQPRHGTRPRLPPRPTRRPEPARARAPRGPADVHRPLRDGGRRSHPGAHDRGPRPPRRRPLALVRAPYDQPPVRTCGPGRGLPRP